MEAADFSAARLRRRSCLPCGSLPSGLVGVVCWRSRRDGGGLFAACGCRCVSRQGFAHSRLRGVDWHAWLPARCFSAIITRAGWVFRWLVGRDTGCHCARAASSFLLLVGLTWSRFSGVARGALACRAVGLGHGSCLLSRQRHVRVKPLCSLTPFRLTMCLGRSDGPGFLWTSPSCV